MLLMGNWKPNSFFKSVDCSWSWQLLLWHVYMCSGETGEASVCWWNQLFLSSAREQSFPRGMTQPHAVGYQPQNSGKNRFKKLCACEYNLYNFTYSEVQFVCLLTHLLSYFYAIHPYAKRYAKYVRIIRSHVPPSQPLPCFLNSCCITPVHKILFILSKWPLNYMIYGTASAILMTFQISNVCRGRINIFSDFSWFLIKLSLHIYIVTLRHQQHTYIGQTKQFQPLSQT